MATIIGIDQPETLIGTIYDDQIKGKGGDDIIIANSGNDTLDGGTGNDSLSGGDGNDTYIVDSIEDIVSEDNGSGGDYGGIDTVKSSVDWTLSDYLENLTLTGTTAINGNGNALNNSIRGNSSSNTLSGGDGDDSILGEAGDDTIYGEAGNDKLSGGDGNDYLEDSLGNNSLYGGAGDDYLDISNSSGNSLVDGGDGDDRLYTYGSSGSNTLNGGKGNDVLTTSFNSPTEGIITTLDKSTTSGTIRAGSSVINFKNIESLRITGTEYSDSLQGGNGDDYFYDYSGGDDTFKGGAGNDVLATYSSGNNFLDGGSGNDGIINYYGTGNSLLVGGDGNDGIQVSFSSGNHTLNGGDGDDVLTIYYFDVFDVYYTPGDNLLVGGDGNDDLTIRLETDSGVSNNTLNGGNGDDSFTIFVSRTDPSSPLTQIVDGGTGYDFLYIGSLFENSTEGIITTLDSTNSNGTITSGNSVISFQDIERFEIYGTQYSDSLLGGNGNDSFSGGGGGNDTINGGAGDDTIFISDYLGNSLIDGGTGYDFLYNLFYNATEGIVTVLDSTNTNGTITSGNYQISFQSIERFVIGGTQYSDSLLGGNGNDSFYGSSIGINNGDDTINSGNGDDSIYIYDFGGLIDGGTGYDFLYADLSFTEGTQGIVTVLDSTNTNGTITSGNYHISFQSIERLDITGTYYSDSLQGGNGNDFLDGNDGGNDTILGGAGDDSLYADYSTGDNLLDGGDGNDIFYASGFYSYEGAAYGASTSGNNTLLGGAGDDSLYADYSTGDNLLDGGDGNDILYASGDSLAIQYGVSTSGNSTLIGGAGDDTLSVTASIGDNSLSGGDGNDYLIASGALGNNTLNGGAGDDTLIAGNGNDLLIGDAGTDIFGFYSYTGGIDTIDDFNAANEIIQVLANNFGGGLLTGTLISSQFVLGTSATTSDQRFIYDDTTGALYFDSDGTGSSFSQVQFAQLDTGLSLTATNFVVVEF